VRDGAEEGDGAGFVAGGGDRLHIGNLR
jgi:hypothetical protein